MVIPLDSQPGTIANMTCPNAQDYYTWEGKDTSAQYYINNKGMTIEEGCVWGDGSQPLGNWAPITLGVGQNGGNKWLSISQNKPTTNAALDFTIELVGDNLSGSCKYSNGQYCAGDDCNEDGCTVSHRTFASWNVMLRLCRLWSLPAMRTLSFMSRCDTMSSTLLRFDLNTAFPSSFLHLYFRRQPDKVWIWIHPSESCNESVRPIKPRQARQHPFCPVALLQFTTSSTAFKWCFNDTLQITITSHDFTSKYTPILFHSRTAHFLDLPWIVMDLIVYLYCDRSGRQ